LGGPFALRLRGHRQKATGAGAKPLQNPPNSQRYNLRKTLILEGFLNFADETENMNLGKQLNLFEF
jgi:hypothetical protein